MLTLFAQAAIQENAGFLQELLHSGPLGYMIDGGFFMWPILLMAVLGFGVVIERFRSLKMIANNADELRDKVLTLLQQDKVEEAISLCARSRGPVPAILAVGLHRYEVLRRLDYDPSQIEEHVEKAMDDYGNHITAALEKHLTILATIANVAPMLGSVGTVVGMVVLFQGILDQYGQVDIIKSAAAGIKLKLIVTVWGLLVGIASYISFNYFNSIINRFILEAQETATAMVEALTIRIASAPMKGAVETLRPAPAPTAGGVA